MQVKRITLAQTAEAVDFGGTFSGKWLVKNFGENDITVAFDQDALPANRIKIKAGFGQLVVENEMRTERFEHDRIYLWGDVGTEVEVQQLWYHNANTTSL